MSDEFDGRLYALSYTRPDGAMITTHPVGAKSIAVLAADHAFRESGVIATSRAHQLNVHRRLMLAPLETDIRDHVTQCVFRIDVVGCLPTFEAVRQGEPHE